MRFILNFIFFGILFYIIYLFFPDAFQTLVAWANKTYEFFRNLILEWSGEARSKEDSSSTTQTILYLLNFVRAV